MNCPTCRGVALVRLVDWWNRGYQPLTESDRFLKCPKCFAAYWLDGPSLLPRTDENRKRSHTGSLITLTDAQIDKVNRT